MFLDIFEACPYIRTASRPSDKSWFSSRSRQAYRRAAFGQLLPSQRLSISFQDARPNLLPQHKPQQGLATLHIRQTLAAFDP